MGIFSNSLKVDKNNKNLKIAIITSEWNSTITNNLLSETIETLLKFELKKQIYQTIKSLEVLN